jgi:AraC family transcriptional regulator of adaptative response/methylated-DNA-[protein]-cysteine methyltransferase
MYRAVLARDAAYEGVFLTAVKTTGIFCRPTCPSRTPRRGNVEFFGSAREAMLAGYRPCKRCSPLDNGSPQPPWLRRLTERIETDPSRPLRSADLRAMKIDPARASRWFKRHHGMTFQAFHRARRMGMALAAVRSGRRLDRAGFDAGFESASGFRDAFERVFGTTPGKAGGASCLLARWLDTPLGAMLAIAGDDGLCLLEFVDRRMLQTQLARVRRRFGSTIVPGDNTHLRLAAAELERYFAGELRQFTVALAMHGTPFQMKVWNALLEIPYGATSSYAELARDIGHSGSQRAVGRTNGDNRIAIIIPCHRVVRSDGTLCGYGGGVWRKKWLLEHEQRHAGTSESNVALLNRVNCSHIP